MEKLQKDAIVDEFFSNYVADPFRWLEEAQSEMTKNFINEQNERTFSYLRSLNQREHSAKRLTQLYNYPRYSLPVRAEGQVFFAKNDGLQNQAVWYQDSDHGPSVFLDPNALATDGTIAVTHFEPARDGSCVAYALSASGSDWQEIRVRDTASGKDREDHIKWVKFTSIAWAPDHSGFYYTRFPEPGTVAPVDESRHSQVYYHILGSTQAEDSLVFSAPEDPELSFDPYVTEDGRYLVLRVWRGTSPKNRLYFRDLQSQDDFVRLFDEEDAGYSLIHNVGSVFYVLTDHNAPHRQVIAIDIDNPDRANWQTVIPAGQGVISDVAYACERLLVTYTTDAHQVLRVFTIHGETLDDVPLPGVGSVIGVASLPEDPKIYVQFSTYLYPAQVFMFHVESGELTTHFPVTQTFNTEPYETRQVFYTSQDGTSVPMFITCQKNISLTGNHLTLLYGYGGFNVGLTPSFSAMAMHWLESGGVFAVANLRGGDEYGETWHEAGMLHKKQNVFDDFHAAAKWLIENGYTKPEKLAIQGASNGGLLVASCMLQRPELYGAVLCQVPVTDMLRYHLFTVGRYWISEYGNAHENKEDFDTLITYSPLHNVLPSVKYPPILITTADTDDRVVPAHSLKFAATLQDAAPDDAHIYLRVETHAGHGAGKPISKIIEEQADLCAFLFNQLAK